MARDEALVAALNAWQLYVNNWAVGKGFWDVPDDYVVDDFLHRLVKSQKMMLMVSELGEALEALRKPGESEKIPGFSGEEEELADLAIRLFDYCGHYKIRLAEAIIAKSIVNEGRPHKHGKAF